MCHLLEIIQAARQEGKHLDVLLKEDRNKVEDDCYERALQAAVEIGSCNNAEKLILGGAGNIEEVMKHSKQVDIALMLLMVKTAKENNHKFLQALFNNPESEEVLKYFVKSNTPTHGIKAPNKFPEETVLVDNNLEAKYVISPDKIREHVDGRKMRTKVPIKIASKSRHKKVLDELILRTNIDIDSGSVGWSGLSLSEVDIKWLQRVLLVIKYLDLSQNQLVALPTDIAVYLKKCTKLHLHKNNITEITRSILELPFIQEVDLSFNKLSSLPNVSWSASLVRLNLSHNKLSSLPGCATSLCTYSVIELSLSCNLLTEVPKCICFLHEINNLDISYNSKIRDLPVELGRLKKLNNLNLEGLYMYRVSNPLSAFKNTAGLVSHLRDQFLQQTKCYHMKLMIVGKTVVGKTTMVGCLQGRRVQENPDRTIGVDICKWSYQPKMFDPTFHFNVWDFAGQEEYYATHQVFLSTRSLYLAVWNVTEGVYGINELKPWLDNIILRAPQSRVIVIGTHLDVLIDQLGGKQAADAKCEEYTRHFYNNVDREFIENNVAGIYYVGLKGRCVGMTELKKQIYNVARDYKVDGNSIMGSDIPYSYTQVDKRLSKLSKHILQAEEFKEMVRSLKQTDLQSNDDIRAAALFLHGIGSLLHFDDHRHNLDDLYFVKPQWLCKLMATVVTVGERNEYVDNGIITRDHLQELFRRAGGDYSDQFIDQYLELFNRFEIALPLNKAEDKFMIPCFLPSVRPGVVEPLSTELHFQRNYLFQTALPPGLWSRLLSCLINSIDVVGKLLDQITSMPQQSEGKLRYWSTGLYCCTSDQLFCIESCRIGSNDGISIIVSFQALQRGIMSQLVNLVQQIVSEWFPGLVDKCEQVFPCYECAAEGHQSRSNVEMFKIKQLLTHLENGTKFDCSKCKKEIDLKLLAPDILLDDVKKIDHGQVKCFEIVVWKGKYGTAFHGELETQHGEVLPVIVKQYKSCKEGSTEENVKLFDKTFRTLRAEVAFLQKINHPCLVAMVGVCGYPNLTLVIEDGPLGTLDMCLLKEKSPVPRIVVYRIAAQITSALHFLHTIPIIYRHLTATRVLMWSLSMDELINCKLADLEIVTYGDTAGGIQSHFAGQFIAPEVRQQAIYDYRVDTFSLGALFLQVLQRNYPVEERYFLPEWEIPRHYEAIAVPDSELHYLGSLVKQCCQTNPDNRPDLHMVVQQLCDPVNQLVMDVITLRDSNPVTCACASTSDVWLCCQGVNGAYVSVFSVKNLEMEEKYFIESHQICYMFSRHDQVWATSKLAGGKGALLKIENKEDNCTYSEILIQTQVDGTLSDGDYGTSLACSNTHVYVGTANGWCLMFDLNPGKVPVKERKLSCNPIRSLVIIKSTSLLWVSAGDQILFISLEDLEFDKDKKGINVDWQVGMFYLSPDEEVVWTAHINGHSISAWNPQQRSCTCDVNSHILLDRQLDHYKTRISCASVAMDTLWVGLNSGHIIVVSATLSFPQNLLTVMKPYHQSVQFLVPLYGVDNNMTMLSIGKGYKGHDQNNQLDVIVWEVVTAKYMYQINCLSSGNTWLNDAALNEVNYNLYA